jgi:hypothetical protein
MSPRRLSRSVHLRHGKKHQRGPARKRLVLEPFARPVVVLLKQEAFFRPLKRAAARRAPSVRGTESETKVELM